MKNTETQGDQPEFDAFAEDYDTVLNQGLKISGEDKNFFAEGRTQWLKSKLTEIGAASSRTLDFGCGTGSATPFLYKHLGSDYILGVDPSEKSLAQARAAWSGDYSVEFATPEGEHTGNFDLAFCNGVFHHIPLAERKKAVQFVYDQLKPGGVFAFWENNPWNPGTRYAMSRVPFDKDAILVWPHGARKLLTENGFSILRTDYVFFFPRLLSRLRMLEPFIHWLPFGGQYLVLCQKAK